MADALEIVASTAPVVDVVDPGVVVVEVLERGRRGPAGPVADLNTVLGAVDGAVADYFTLHPQTFDYNQPTEVFHVDIMHPLDHLPEVIAVDSAGTRWRGSVGRPAPNRVTIDFNLPFAGKFTLI